MAVSVIYKMVYVGVFLFTFDCFCVKFCKYSNKRAKNTKLASIFFTASEGLYSIIYIKYIKSILFFAVLEAFFERKNGKRKTENVFSVRSFVGQKNQPPPSRERYSRRCLCLGVPSVGRHPSVGLVLSLVSRRSLFGVGVTRLRLRHPPPLSKTSLRLALSLTMTVFSHKCPCRQ